MWGRREAVFAASTVVVLAERSVRGRHCLQMPRIWWLCDKGRKP
jgi:hypothetical protein